MSTLALPNPRAIGWPRAAISWLPGGFVTLTGAILWLRPPTDPDLGWHLRTGQLILASNQVPRTDPFSHTMAGAPWVDNEWLWETTIAVINGAFGWLGLVALNAALMSLTIALLVCTGCLRRVPPLFAAAGAMLTVINLIPYGDVRPGMIGIAASAAFLFLLEKQRCTADWRWLVALLPLQVLWANCHGSYPIGLLLPGLYALSELWHNRHWHALISWVGLGAALLLASLINPLGIGLIRFTLFASRLTFNREHVNAWRAPTFHSLTLVGLLTTLILSLVVLTWCLYHRAKLPLIEMLLLLASGLGVLRTLEFLPLFAVAGAPVAAQLLQRAIRRPIGWTLSGPQVSALGLASLFLAVLPSRSLGPGSFERAISAQYPVAAVDYIEQQHLEGPMWNAFNWGGYLISALPRLPVLLDSRTEMYGDPFLLRFLAVDQGDEQPDAILNDYAIKLVLVPMDSVLARELRQEASWNEAFHDDMASVFTRG